MTLKWLFSDGYYCQGITLKISGKSDVWFKSYSRLKIEKKPKNASFCVTST